MSKSFPEARVFLSEKVLGPDYPTKHLIEQARNKGFITRGKRGRGAEPVSSKDMATLLCASLAGDTPQAATDALIFIQSMRPYGFEERDATGNTGIIGFGVESWSWSFIEMVTAMIDVSRKHYDADFEELTLSIIREPILSAQIVWSDSPLEPNERVRYYLENQFVPRAEGKRRLEVSYGGSILRDIGDWLEDRTEHP